MTAFRQPLNVVVARTPLPGSRPDRRLRRGSQWAGDHLYHRFGPGRW
jgi:hypothetical protein